VKPFRKYGKKPFDVVLVHGGPGAAGEMAPVALKLSSFYGVLEPMQTKTTISAQVEELKQIIIKQADVPVILLGFSWGAWLSIILTSQHPSLVKKLVLVGCGPIEHEMAARVFNTRFDRLAPADRERVTKILKGLENNAIQYSNNALHEVGSILSRADCYEAIEHQEEQYEISAEIYRSIWPEAAGLRKSGQLFLALQHINCPVVAIHGDYDPHPVAGVIEPFSKAVTNFNFHLLRSCGHKPWIERHARDNFFRLVFEIISI
jgi:pimeloyl-ACP methyl ester carboxylesterase